MHKVSYLLETVKHCISHINIKNNFKYIVRHMKYIKYSVYISACKIIRTQSSFKTLNCRNVFFDKIWNWLEISRGSIERLANIFRNFLICSIAKSILKFHITIYKNKTFQTLFLKTRFTTKQLNKR